MLEVAERNTCAVPWKLPLTLGGQLHVINDFFDGLGGIPSAMPGARLKESVTAGNCPWWLTERLVLEVLNLAKLESGTILPAEDLTKIFSSAEGSSKSRGETSRIT